MADEPNGPGASLSPGQREEIVAALALGADSQTDIARTYGVDRSTITRIKHANAQKIATLKKDFGELSAGYLQQLLNTLTKQAEIVSEEDYIRKQPAGELAVLHGVLADKGFRLLSAVAEASRNRPAVTSDGNSIP